MDKSFLHSRIEATKKLIVAYEQAIEALSGLGAQSYTLDTGQSRQTVTRLDLRALNSTLDSLYNRHATLNARLHGSGSIYMRPGW